MSSSKQIQVELDRIFIWQIWIQDVNKEEKAPDRVNSATLTSYILAI